MPQAETPATPSTPPGPRPYRALRLLALSFGVLLALVALAVAGGWIWLGSSQSLAAAITQAARYLPAGQTLEAHEVEGSLRAGGRIGWLRWQSPSLAVEVNEARIGWVLRPLLQKQLKFAEVRVNRISIERRGPAEERPSAPIEQLMLPIDIDLPFEVDALQISQPALEVLHLKGRYRYGDSRHTLDLAGVEVADGLYNMHAKLEGAAPMTIEVAVDGQVAAPIAEQRSLALQAEALIQGTLAKAVASRLHNTTVRLP